LLKLHNYNCRHPMRLPRIIRCWPRKTGLAMILL